MSDVAIIFRNFQGSWSFDRVMYSLENEIQGELQGTAKGEATFALLNSSMTELFFSEEGTSIHIHLSGSSEHEFFRHYKYHLNNNQIEIYHAGGPQHGQLYQTYILNPQGNRLDEVQTHDCGLDKYDSFYELINENNFTLTTKMHGPKKNSIIKTNFHRVIE